jgi:hypothetical protein
MIDVAYKCLVVRYSGQPLVRVPVAAPKGPLALPETLLGSISGLFIAVKL